MNEREYLRLRRQIQDDAKKKLEALDLVWEMVSGTSDSGGNDDDGNPVRRGAIEAVIRKVLPQLAGTTFGPQEVRARVEQADPSLGEVNRSTVSSALKRLAEEGRIILVEAGKGKRPTRYKTKVASLRPSDFVPDEPEPELEPEPEPETLSEPLAELTDDDIPF